MTPVLRSAPPWLWLVVVLLMLAAPRSNGQAASQYLQLLAELDRGIAGELSHNPGARHQIENAERALATVNVVRTADAGPVPVDCRLLILSVHQAESAGPYRQERLADAYRQVRALEQAVEQSEAPAAASSDPEVAAREELSKQIYAADPPPEPSSLDREMVRLSQWLSRTFRGFHPHSRTEPEPQISPAFIRVLIFLVVAGLFALLVTILVQNIRRSAGRAGSLALEDTEAALVEARDTTSLHALAEQQARRGDYRRAFRLVYLATLMALDSGGVLRFDRSRTNWEYLRALRAAGYSDIVRELQPFTREFDRVWYGLEAVDRSAYERARQRFATAQAMSAPPEAKARK